MNDQQIEQEIQAKGLTAPRVTPQDIEANIASAHYFTAAQGCAGSCNMSVLPDGWVQPLNLLTFCVLVLRNGFTVTGESACASPENFDAEVGRKIARANAISKVWPLMGYALKERLAAQSPDFRTRVRAEAAELDERIKKLAAFTSTNTFHELPNEERVRLLAQLAAMDDYSGCLAQRIRAFGEAA
jgi:hypothetical protein